MDIAVTGSNGLIGSQLTSALRDSGHRVLRLVRSGGGSDTAIWNPDAGTIDAASLEGIGSVVHLAGEGIAEKRWTADQKERIRTSRTAGTHLLATTLASLDRPPTQLLSGSAIGFYGDTGDREIDESTPAGTGFLAEVCIEWERSAAPAAAAGISTSFLRTGIVLSTEGGALAKQLPFFRAGIGGRSGSGKQFQSWISIEDEIRAIIWLIDHPVDGAVNLTAPNPITNAEFAKTLGRAVHRPTTTIPMAGPRVLYGRELADNLLLSSSRIIPRALLRSGFEFHHPTLDVALAALLNKDPR